MVLLLMFSLKSCIWIYRRWLLWWWLPLVSHRQIFKSWHEEQNFTLSFTVHKTMNYC